MSVELVTDGEPVVRVGTQTCLAGCLFAGLLTWCAAVLLVAALIAASKAAGPCVPDRLGALPAAGGRR